MESFLECNIDVIVDHLRLGYKKSLVNRKIERSTQLKGNPTNKQNYQMSQMMWGRGGGFARGKLEKMGPKNGTIIKKNVIGL